MKRFAFAIRQRFLLPPFCNYSMPSLVNFFEKARGFLSKMNAAAASSY